MSIRKYKPEQIVTVLRQVEVQMANGKTAPQACKEAGIHTQTYYLYGLLPFCKKNRDHGKRGRLHTCIRRQQEPMVLPVRPNGKSARTRLNRWSAPGGHDRNQVWCSSVRPALPLPRCSSQPFSVKLYSTDFRYASPFANNAQRMRAFLLATARMVRLVPRRFCRAWTQA